MNIGIDLRPLLSRQATGVEKYTNELLKNLFKVSSDHKFFLFYNSYKNNDLSNWKKKENVDLIEKNFPNKLLNLSLTTLNYPKLDKLVASEIEKKLDVFFSPNLNFGAYSNEVAHILTIHDLSFEFFSECYSTKRQIWHKVINIKQKINQADKILCPSKNTKQDIEDLYDIDNSKLEVLRPGINKKKSTQKSLTETRKKFNLKKNFIFFLGTVEPRKNILSAVSAFNRLNLAKFEFIIAGADGWRNEQIKEEIETSENIRYIGYVTDQEKYNLLELAKVFVYPSLYEGFGFPVLEAMSCSTPVVTSNRSSLPEISETAAYLVDPLDSADLATAIKKIVSNDKLAEKLTTRGNRQAKKFSWKSAANKFLKVIDNAEKP
jgi:glycosyltransferase involved in cell wall biosynthesis